MSIQAGICLRLCQVRTLSGVYFAVKLSISSLSSWWLVCHSGVWFICLIRPEVCVAGCRYHVHHVVAYVYLSAQGWLTIDCVNNCIQYLGQVFLPPQGLSRQNLLLSLHLYSWRCICTHLGGLSAHLQGQVWSVGVHLATWLAYVYLPSLESSPQILMWDLSISTWK